MLASRRFLYALLPDPEEASTIARMRQGLALRFPLHVTLRGRFDKAPGVTLEELVNLGRSIFQGVEAFSANFSGIHNPRPNLGWFECDHNSSAREVLQGLHCCLNDSLNQKNMIGWDMEPIAYRYQGYRPHLTVHWSLDTLTETELLNTAPEQPSLETIIFRRWAILTSYDPPFPEPAEIAWSEQLLG